MRVIGVWILAFLWRYMGQKGQYGGEILTLEGYQVVTALELQT